MERTQDRLENLIHSYVPEFSYDEKGSDPGSVLTNLCAGMIEDSKKRFDQVIPRNRLQYLNLFDALIKEPVCAARGYECFTPVSGVEEMILIPKGTQVMHQRSEGDIIFETEHDLTVTDTTPELLVAADGDKDKLIVTKLTEQKDKSFYAFDIRGENQSCHRLYLGFDELFDGVSGLDVFINVEGTGKEDRSLLEYMASSQVSWFVVDGEMKEVPIPSVSLEQGRVHLVMPEYVPIKTTVGQREAYYLICNAKEKLPEAYLGTLSVSFAKQKVVPEAIYCNGISQIEGSCLPFGKPLGLYNTFSVEDRDVLSRKGATITMNFHLDYRTHEAVLDIPEYDTEYKAIMKKPRKPLAVNTSEVNADYVLWEYRSVDGWKRLFNQEYVATLFNGSSQGDTTLTFTCPEDMIPYGEESEGRIRARLITAENIYHIPAIYHCPVISGFTLSYTYEDAPKAPQVALSQNNYESKDLTEALRKNMGVLPFYKTEEPTRAMYLGFSGPVYGTPFGLYFDLENVSDYPLEFRIEYLTADGFRPVKVVDYTDGMCGSGVMLMVIPTDMKKSTLYGYEGYFIRFLLMDKEVPNYALPLIKGIYPNMARIVNRNSVLEEFFIEPDDEAVSLQLNQDNLLKVSVEVQEQTPAGPAWIPWNRAESLYEGGRTYQIDMATGLLSFRKNAFALYPLFEEGPHVRVEHSNYTGAVANLPEDSIDTMGISIRYISDVSNPFPTYGGYDSYSEELQMEYVGGLLRTRLRAVTEKDFLDVISQCVHGVRSVKCVNHVDERGRKKPEDVTIAVLIEEYEKGAHVFSEIKRDIRERLLQDSSLLVTGRHLNLIQPHFVKVNIRVWLEKDGLEHSYDIQQKAMDLITEFLNPLSGGQNKTGWEIGAFPRPSQIVATLRNGIAGCNINKLLMTAMIDGQEVPVDDVFIQKQTNPFLMAVSGEHVVYIEVN